MVDKGKKRAEGNSLNSQPRVALLLQWTVYVSRMWKESCGGLILQTFCYLLEGRKMIWLKWSVLLKILWNKMNEFHHCVQIRVHIQIAYGVRCWSPRKNVQIERDDSFACVAGPYESEMNDFLSESVSPFLPYSTTKSGWRRLRFHVSFCIRGEEKSRSSIKGNSFATFRIFYDSRSCFHYGPRRTQFERWN